MASFTLEIDEFAAMVGFLNARKVVGMDERIFAAFNEKELPFIMAKLHKHGWMEPADRPNTWHTNEDLLQTLTIAIAPEFAVLARSKALPKSILFYVARKDFVQIVVTADQVVVTNIAGEDELGASVAKFLDAAWPAEIVVAHVDDDKFDAGRVALVDDHGVITTTVRGALTEAENAWSAGAIAEFVRGSLDELHVSP